VTAYVLRVSIRVDERRPGRRETAREAAFDGSRGPRARFAALGAALRGSGGVAIAVASGGALAAVLLVATEFLTVASVDVAAGSCEVIEETNPEVADRCVLNGFERNGGAFLLLAVLMLVMAWGASVGGSKPAAWALIGLGAAVLLWSLLVDLPATNDTGGIGPLYANAKADAGPGLFTELAAGVLAVGLGALRLLRPD
jgi:hypothetical protein